MLSYEYMNTRNARPAFTIVELLIVIVVIAILAAITLVAYNGMSNRATDTRRASDLASIKKMLLLYNSTNTTPASPEQAQLATLVQMYIAGVSPNWLAFLRPTNPVIPVDPVNTMATGNNPPAAGNFNYFYACYSAGAGPLPATANVRTGYHKTDGSIVTLDFPVDACL